MATLVCFHAHPDDEAIATGGTMAKAAAEGHRVVLVTATRGEHGEVPEGYLPPGEPLWERRVKELAEACQILGVARQEFLGYTDSGMMGTPENEHAESFWQADVDEAAARLAVILTEENADVLTIYDDHGNYGHPDHIQVHRVGQRAAEMAGVTRVYEATINRDHLLALIERAAELGLTPPGDVGSREGMEEMGSPASAIDVEIDVRPWLDVKRRALRAHGSQIVESSLFASMPDEAFEAAFGQEWFIRGKGHAGPRATSLFDWLGS